MVGHQGDHLEAHERGGDVSHHIDRKKNDEAEEIGHEPAVLQNKVSGDAERHANQPGHGGEDEIAEKQPQEHQDRPE